MALDTVFSFSLSLGLGLLFAGSGFAKLRNHNAFREGLDGYQLLPPSLLPVFAIGIPLLEVSLALGLVLLTYPVISTVAAGGASLLLLYGAAIHINVRRGNLSLDCGCQFGDTRQTISAALVYRNLVLAGAALLLLLPPSSRILGGLDYIAVGFAVMVFSVLYETANRLISNAVSYRQGYL